MQNLALPYIRLKVAVSLDGYLDDASSKPRIFSNAEDSLAVDLLRADSDAVLVGAETIRKDNPRLVVRDQALRERRLAAGLSTDPIKVTITSSGKIPADSRFLKLGDSRKIIYSIEEKRLSLQNTIGADAELVFLESKTHVDLVLMLQDLAKRGVKTLLVEGGAKLVGQFLILGLADEMRVAISPEIVGDKRATRFLDHLALNPNGQITRKPILDSVQKLGEIAVLTFKF